MIYSLFSRLKLLSNAYNEQEKAHESKLKQLQDKVNEFKERTAAIQAEKKTLEDTVKSLRTEVTKYSVQQQQAVYIMKHRKEVNEPHSTESKTTYLLSTMLL